MSPVCWANCTLADGCFLPAALRLLLSPAVRYCIRSGRSGGFAPGELSGVTARLGDADLARLGRSCSLAAAARSSAVLSANRSLLYGLTPRGLSGFCFRIGGVLLGRVGAGGSSVSCPPAANITFLDGFFLRAALCWLL